MAVYHLTTKVVQRSKGHSAVAAAAYRAREELHNERTGETWNYSKNNADVLFAGIVTPKGAPEWMRDRTQLWNALEKADRQYNAQVARDFVIALPHELNLEQQQFALKNWVKENFTDRGFVADIAIHRPSSHGDTRNIHAHVLVSMRQVEGDGFSTRKYRSDNRKEDLLEWRQSWEKHGNKMLVRAGFEPTLDHRSNEDRGIDLTPTIHLGKDAAKMEMDGKPTDRGDQLRAILRENEAKELARKIAAKMEEAAQGNTKAQERANDDAPTVKQPAQPEAPDVTVSQSAVDRMNAEARREQLDALRGFGRNAWAAMGDNLRGMVTALRSLKVTMGEAISSIIVGGDFFGVRRTASVPLEATKGTEATSGAKPAAPTGGGRAQPKEQTAELRPSERLAAEMTREAAARKAVLESQQVAAVAAASAVKKPAEDPLKTLDRMAAERKAARDKARADQANEELRRVLEQAAKQKRGPKLNL